MSDYGTSVIVSHGTPAVVLDRVTAPDDPSQAPGGDATAGALSYAYWQLGYPDLWGEVRPSAAAALTYAAVFACVRVICNAFVSMSWHNYERSADGKSKVPLFDDVSWLIDMQANGEQNAIDWRTATVKDALLRGNGYSEIERLNNGKPTALWRIDPSRVDPVRDESGALWYQVSNGIGKEPSYLTPDNVYHLKGPSEDGIVGWDVIKLAQRGISLGLAEERFGESVFTRGPMPGGVVTIPGNLNKEQRRDFRRSFEEVYSGQRNSSRIVVLSNGVTFTASTLPNDSAQFLESRRFQVSEICRWFGVPPHKLADLERATFSNIEEQEIGFVRDCILPWARRLEAEADVKLYGRTTRGRRFTRFDLDQLQRGDSIAQTTTMTQQVNGGIRTVNEARDYLGLNPMEGADVLLVQGAMVTLDRVVNPPEPPAPPAPPKQPEPSQNGKPETNGKVPTDRFGDLLAALATPPVVNVSVRPTPVSVEIHEQPAPPVTMEVHEQPTPPVTVDLQQDKEIERKRKEEDRK